MVKKTSIAGEKKQSLPQEDTVQFRNWMVFLYSSMDDEFSIVNGISELRR